jgi:hypothetical protein
LPIPYEIIKNIQRCDAVTVEVFGDLYKATGDAATYAYSATVTGPAIQKIGAKAVDVVDKMLGKGMELAREVIFTFRLRGKKRASFADKVIRSKVYPGQKINLEIKANESKLRETQKAAAKLGAKGNRLVGEGPNAKRAGVSGRQEEPIPMIVVRVINPEKKNQRIFLETPEHR